MKLTYTSPDNIIKCLQDLSEAEFVEINMLSIIQLSIFSFIAFASHRKYILVYFLAVHLQYGDQMLQSDLSSSSYLCA